MLDKWSLFHSVVDSALVILCLIMAAGCILRKPWAWGRVYVWIPLAIFFLLGGLSYANSLTTYRQIAPGVVESTDGYLYKNDIPLDAPVVYRGGDPTKSGYALRWCRWLHIIYVDPYDPHVAERDLVLYRTNKEVLLTGNKIVSAPKNLAVIKAGADAFWYQDRHHNEIQQEFEMLARPSSGGEPRIEQWIFR